jgi:glutathione S-transferase
LKRRAAKIRCADVELGMATKAILTINSKNYGAWSLRGWLLARFAGLDFTERTVSPDDPDNRNEMLLLSSSILVPRLDHNRARVWDTLAIAEYLNELKPKSGLLPSDRIARAHCRSICGEMHSGFASMRSALPMNIRARFPGFKVWARAQADIDRVLSLWSDCLAAYSGPYLFGARTMADAMYAPVVTRFITYDVKLPPACSRYCETVLAMPEMRKWIDAAKAEPEAIDELEVEF